LREEPKCRRIAAGSLAFSAGKMSAARFDFLIAAAAFLTNAGSG
jgi:hypothetical protein